MSNRITSLLFAAALTFLGGCATSQIQATSGLRVECNVPDAALWLDDHLAGRASEWAGKDHMVRPGFYRVELRHPAYYSYMGEVTVTDGGSAVIKAELHPLLE
jgi:hypothetical protein